MNNTRFPNEAQRLLIDMYRKCAPSMIVKYGKLERHDILAVCHGINEIRIVQGLLKSWETLNEHLSYDKEMIMRIGAVEFQYKLQQLIDKKKKGATCTSTLIV